MGIKIMNISIDAMGGDNAPKVVVEGAMIAIKKFDDITITLVGNENEIKKYLDNDTNERITIIHTEEKIESTDEPVRAVRRKKNSSMVLMAKEVKEGRSQACISAGNTGGLMATGLFVIGRIKGIDRPALSPILPTVDGRGFQLLDAGANVDEKPENLLQYAIMGSTYAEKVRNIEKPKVGLLNVGTEQGKGSELMKLTYSLLENAPINFIGNVESRYLLNGVADVVVADGFTGNMVLKSMEGTAMSIFSMLKEGLTSSLKSKVAASILKPELKEIKNKMDYSEYGGALLMGLTAPVVKAHGSSDQIALYNAIRQAREMVNKEVTGAIHSIITTEENKINRD